MKKQIVKILPYFEPRIWGGKRILENFNYETDVYPVGEVYNVVALRQGADCKVEGFNLTLSKLYDLYPDWFDCDTKELPIRVNLLDPLADLSIQLHPNDEYATKHDASRGKPEAWVILDTPPNGRIAFGHNAKTKEQFEKWATNNEWDKLLKYLTAKKDYFIDIPSGTLHAIGKDVLTYNVSRNADLTYRLYDYDRIDKTTGKKRKLHIEKVFDNVLIPDESKGFVWFDPYYKNGCKIFEYWDEPGLYTLNRIIVEEIGFFEFDRFMFLTCVEGFGTINNININKGETLLIPSGINQLEIKGNLDIFLASYRNNK
ncbi:MAG: mannose-6-phosphate isomerase [Erysipelotrichaceae bacterium]|nr:mannose-6-phosphate isomerase [Erysipelotrichaceae bacterium]